MLHAPITSSDDFADLFARYGRRDQFTRAAFCELFDYFDSLAECGEPIVLDPVGICTEWAEYSQAELLDEYGDGSHGPGLTNAIRDAEAAGRLVEQLRDEHTVLYVPNPNGAGRYIVGP